MTSNSSKKNFVNSRKDIIRILVSATLLALTTIVSLPTAAKAAFVLLAIGILVIHRHNSQFRTSLQVWGVCFAVAIGTITVCSKSSFLYPFNDWVDANCFFTVGKSMMNGIVVYRDLLEQKGPFLYVLHGIAWLISHNTFIGVYLIEIIAATFFLFYTHRVFRLFIKSDWTLLLIPVSAVLIYTEKAFRHGDSVEELALPCLAYAMWVGIDAMCNQRKITSTEFFVVGLTAGLIFWSKFTVVGLYVGWYLFPAFRYLREGDWNGLFRSALFVLLGVAAATLPFVIYFGIHGAIDDWLTVYLYDNLFKYSVMHESHAILPPWVTNVINSVDMASIENRRIPLLCALGVVVFLRKKFSLALYLVVTAGFLMIFAFAGGMYSPYYAFSLNVFLPYGLILFWNVIQWLLRGRLSAIPKNGLLISAVTLCVALSCYLTPNRYLMLTPQKEMPQYQFASIIGTDGSAKILNYGFLDGGFHTVTHTLPQDRVFCLLNISMEKLRAIQDSYVLQRDYDYVITRDELLNSDRYVLISSSTMFFEDKEYTYYLYGLNKTFDNSAVS